MLKKILLALLVLIVLGGIAVGIGAWLMYAPNTPNFEDGRSVKIPRGASFEQATDSLDARGILRSRTYFTWVARATGWGDQIKAGHYVIEAGASNYDLLSKLRRGLQEPIRLIIPPGSRPEVVAAVVGRDMGDFEKEDLLAALRDPALAAELGTDTTHLFSYLLPDTYNFYWLTDERTVIRRIKEYFDDYWTPERQQQAEALGLDVEDVLNLAAIVEWESHHEPERPRVAGVYLNRLNTRGWRLEADPTVQYAVLEREGRKRRLFNVDYGIVHPYNTYLIDGLPPGPVTNPSRSSIDAVLNAEDHDYMFFVAKGDGSHTFSRTLGEHTRAAREFHQLMRERRRQQAADSAAGE